VTWLRFSESDEKVVWALNERNPENMKGKRYSPEDKIRILREADSGKSMLEVCREHNISEGSFQRWKRLYGQMELSEARRLKELEL
jgi:putative transposase